MRFRECTSTSLVRHVLILLASWGVLSTTAVAVVILSHSVIALVPMFLCWGWLLSRYEQYRSMHRLPLSSTGR
jgi:hypothetical protein